MAEDFWNEAQAANELRVHPKTLARWRRAGMVPFSRTFGGRIRYNFEQLAQIGASMRVDALRCSTALPDAPARSLMSGEIEAAAE